MNKKKSLGIIILVALIVAIIVGMAFIFVNSKDAQSDIGTTVSVKDGVVVTDPIINQIELESSANRIHVEWGTEEIPGFVSAIVVKDTTGKEIFVCTGDAVSADSVDLDLEKGSYTVEISYFASQDELSAFANVHNLEMLGDPFKGFGQDGIWQMNYSISMSKGRNYYRNIGILCGLMIGLLLAIILLKVTKTNNSIKCEYDERQEAERGRGFKYGFFTAIIYNCIAALLLELEIELPMDTTTTFFVGIIVAASVMVTHQIFHDCYFSLNEDRKKVMAVLSFAAIINLISAYNNYRMGELFKDGKLCFQSLNLICFAICIYVALIVLVKMLIDKREED